ncbi:hypothetical protein LJR289_001068 [Pseudoduganella sp. LjRoot289]|uniref:hypothetical protein n=1 Tax=Pseudoduganella sp. LjRoot289 TaxID=3342314 RepID=UPI003ECE8786
MGYEPTQSIKLPFIDFLNLEFHLMETHPGVKPETFVTELVQRWLKIEMERLALRKNGRAKRGFQWKNIFLPDGTSLRTSYCNTVEFANVVNEYIVTDDGASLTPSLFANRHAKGRNAWRFVLLRFPGDDFWIRAADCRIRFEELQRKQSKSKTELSNVV